MLGEVVDLLEVGVELRSHGDAFGAVDVGPDRLLSCERTRTGELGICTESEKIS